jgi:hypothetical protein
MITWFAIHPLNPPLHMIFLPVVFVCFSLNKQQKIYVCPQQRYRPQYVGTNVGLPDPKCACLWEHAIVQCVRWPFERVCIAARFEQM